MQIDTSNFNDRLAIEERVSLVEDTARGALRTALSYLYLDDGPTNLPRARIQAAIAHLDPAENIVMRWPFTRTNGSGRRSYGKDALHAARRSRYQCETCGMADVRGAGPTSMRYRQMVALRCTVT